MKLVAPLENVTRKIRTTIYVWAPISLRPQRVGTSQTHARMNPSRIRLEVLRRDCYRCRSCNQLGDEITLEVRQICPGASTIEEMLTLCVHCRNLAKRWNITANSGPEFLGYLQDRFGSESGNPVSNFLKTPSFEACAVRQVAASEGI